MTAARLKLALLKEHIAPELQLSLFQSKDKSDTATVLTELKNEEVPTSQFHVLSRWYYLSLLDLCTC